MGTYWTFVTSLTSKSDAVVFAEKIRGYLHDSCHIIEAGGMFYVTGVIKTYGGGCEPLLLAGFDIDYGLTWVSDEGDYGSNKEFRD
ncbi:MAG TPA: hypothetical protein PKL22_10585 [Saprospiraceae bacterium]|nr:hypothetical protein [Saprospiraceae bacterium]HNT22613.1 hypothetical protein [Saprospiraceae bacterium]